jgi:hypothetical protein
VKNNKPNKGLYTDPTKKNLNYNDTTERNVTKKDVFKIEENDETKRMTETKEPSSEYPFAM